MVIGQGEIWWADLAEPAASELGFRRPVVVVQCELPKDSVVNVSQLVTLDKTALSERVGRLPRPKLDLVLEGIRTALVL